MKRFLLVALLGIISLSAGAQCNSYGRGGYGYYGRPHFRYMRHEQLSYGYGSYRQEARGYNYGRGAGQYGYNNGNAYNNNNSSYGQGRGGYNNQYNNGGGRGFRR